MKAKPFKNVDELHLYIYEMGKRNGYSQGILDCMDIVPTYSMSNKDFNKFLRLWRKLGERNNKDRA